MKKSEERRWEGTCGEAGSDHRAARDANDEIELLQQIRIDLSNT